MYIYIHIYIYIFIYTYKETNPLYFPAYFFSVNMIYIYMYIYICIFIYIRFILQENTLDIFSYMSPLKKYISDIFIIYIYIHKWAISRVVYPQYTVVGLRGWSPRRAPCAPCEAMASLERLPLNHATEPWAMGMVTPPGKHTKSDIENGHWGRFTHEKMVVFYS